MGEYDLTLKSQEEQFSKMSGGVDSVTKVPKCYYEKEYQHLIVDFPGFGDTNGSQDEIVIQSLFNRITSKSNFKIVYVSQQSNAQLQNRGSDLQSFLKSLPGKKKNIEFENVTLFMNNYNGKVKEEELKKKWQGEIKDALKLEKYQGKIIIQRNAGDEDEIKQYLSPEQRKSIWEELTLTPAVELQPHQFTNKDIITSYLIESINIILFQTFQEQDCKLSTSALTIEELDKVIQQYISIQEILKLATIDNLIDWIDEYLGKIKEVGKILTLESLLKYDEKAFKLIYIFFFDFQDQIDGYKQVGQTIEEVNKNCIINIANFTKQKENLIKLKESEKATQPALERARLQAAENAYQIRLQQERHTSEIKSQEEKHRLGQIQRDQEQKLLIQEEIKKQQDKETQEKEKQLKVENDEKKLIQQQKDKQELQDKIQRDKEMNDLKEQIEQAKKAQEALAKSQLAEEEYMTAKVIQDKKMKDLETKMINLQKWWWQKIF